MFSVSYFWYYVFAVFCCFCIDRNARDGVYTKLEVATVNVGNVCMYASYLFLVIGFWMMGKWWHPIVYFGISQLVGFIPIPSGLVATIGIVAAPALTILMYLSLFGLI